MVNCLLTIKENQKTYAAPEGTVLEGRSRRAGHGVDFRPSHEETGAASHSEAGWAGAATMPRLQPTCCAIVSRSGPSRSRRRPRAPSTHVG